MSAAAKAGTRTDRRWLRVLFVGGVVVLLVAAWLPVVLPWFLGDAVPAPPECGGGSLP